MQAAPSNAMASPWRVPITFLSGSRSAPEQTPIKTMFDMLADSLRICGEIFWQPQSASISSASISMEIESMLSRFERDEGVRLRHTDRILEYLLQHPELMEVVPVMVEAARRHFPQAQLVMDVYQDPEIEDRYLVLYVRLEQYDESLVERLEKAEEEYLSRLANKEGWIQLTTDFRKPE